MTLLTFLFLYIYQKIKKENKILQGENLALEELNLKSKIIEAKNKDIMASIIYAKNIIDAILPPESSITQTLPNSFILNLPKDIIGGDFYWFCEKNDNIYVAAVDCTGHGIPGAFLSIIGINLLEHLANDGITNPATLLNIMNDEMRKILKKNKTKKDLKNGMDMGLCIIDKRRKRLQFSGANNPLYMLREESIVQIKGDRKYVGSDKDSLFSSYTTQLRSNDVFYIFSDGYTDQFGGENNKKYKFKRFRLLLMKIHKLPFEQQRKELLDDFKNWKGSEEQVDDIVIVGFKPLPFSKSHTALCKTQIRR